MKIKKSIMVFVIGITILFVFSLMLYSNDVTLRNGKVITNVKAIPSMDHLRIEYEDGRVEIRNKKEIKRDTPKPVVWDPNAMKKKPDKASKKEPEKTSEEKSIVSEFTGETMTNSIGIEFNLIPAGEFMMGCSDGDTECYEGSKHKVTITKSFYMGKYEVTQGQWKAIMGENPSDFKDCGDNCPVENVSWNDAQEFITKLCDKEWEAKGFFARLISKKTCNYRLPTEAEWEYAARAGTTTKYYENDLNSIAWYDKNSGDKTHPVGQKKPNKFGLYDMSGNVEEWVEDWYDYNYYTSASVSDPQGLASGYRVLRGGSWILSAQNCRSSNRSGYSPDDRFNFIGLRVVLLP
jgi:formylglycine-generating enzyme required for sulfatase activity